MILHPVDYKNLRDLALLRFELGDRAARGLLGEHSWIAQPGWFAEFRW